MLIFIAIPLIYTTDIFGCTLLPLSEQKARATYEKLIDLCKDNPDVVDPLKFLRQREIVHFQRFGEALRKVQDKMADKNYYMNGNNTIFTNNQDNVKNLNNVSCGCGK